MIDLDRLIYFESDFESLVNHKLDELYLKQNYSELSNHFIEILSYFYRLPYHKFDEVDFKRINIFIKKFSELFIKKDFLIPEEHYPVYLESVNSIAYLYALSDYKNTDIILKSLCKKGLKYIRGNKLVKLLALYSSENTYSIDYKKLFKADAKMVSFWYWNYFAVPKFTTEQNYKNYDNHLDNFNLLTNDSVISQHVTNAYTFSTYASPLKDKNIKNRINTLIKNAYHGVEINCQPNPKKIAIVSAYLNPKDSVYRGIYNYLKMLKDSYELTLICLKEDFKTDEADIFNNIIYLQFKNDSLDLSVIPDDFSMIFYCDIGLNPESIFLANLRLAPIQVSCLGQAVSSYDSEIDYYISGNETELLEKVEENYSEKLVLIPGIGLTPTYPFYKKSEEKITNESFIITCPWTFAKINYHHLLNLKEIINKSEKKLVFRFFPFALYNLYFVNLKKDIEAILGEENVEIFPILSEKDYMEKVEESDLFIDSYHFGGYNTAIDALYLNKPFVALDGTKAYNRFAGALLKSLDLNELITNNSEDYIDLVLKLINDNNYRNSLNTKISTINLDSKLFKTDEPEYFKKSIDYLIENHQNLKLSSEKVIKIE